MIPDSLRQVLSPWTPQDAKDPSSDIPKLLYIIPTTQNPTGATLTLQRKKEIYEVYKNQDLKVKTLSFRRSNKMVVMYGSNRTEQNSDGTVYDL